MKDFNNIEELFRENLNGFEADPGAGVWENIAQSLPAQGAAAGGSAATGAATKMAMWKLVAGVAVISTGIGITAGYFYSENKNENKSENQEDKIISENKSVENTTEVNENTVTIAEVKESDLQQNNVIVKDEQKNKTIIVSAKENPKFNMNKSSVDSWITKRTNYSVNTNTQNGNNTVAVITNDPSTESPATFEVKEVDESKPLAAINRSNSGGPAPLTVSFSNATQEKSYEWIIGGSSINVESFTHVFEVPGTYQIKLTVKDANGNKSTDEVEIIVGEPINTEVVAKSKLETKGINVFSPNNDGTNDYLFFDCENLESFILQIVDQEGKVYFESNNPDFRWDGTMMNGELIPEGRYYYYCKAIGKDQNLYNYFKPLEIKTKR